MKAITATRRAACLAFPSLAACGAARAFSTSINSSAGSFPSSWSVIYATQTGNAQAFGLQLADNLPSCSGVQDIYEVDPKELLDRGAHNDKEGGLIFIASTFGKGEFTDSAKKFAAWLLDPARDAENKALLAKGERPLLSHIRFSCFGLGNNNTHASHFNAAAKKLDARLAELGGQRVFPLGLGDDSKQLELDFEQYQAALLQAIKKEGASPGGNSNTASLAAPAPAATPSPAASAAAAAALWMQPQQSLGAPAAAAITKPLLFSPPANSLGSTCATGAPQCPIRVVPDSGASCNPHLLPLAVASADSTGQIVRKMQSVLISGLTNLSPLGSAEFKPIYEVSLSTPGLPFSTGDHLSVMPRAPSAVALALCERLGFDPSTSFALETAKQGAKLPIVGSTTVRNALTRHVDVGAAVTPQMLRVLSLHAGDEQERAALQTLASDGTLYTKLVRERFIRLLDLLYAFPSISLPFNRLLASWPAMVPRYYSIASSSSASTPFTSAGATADSQPATPNKMLVGFKQLRWALPPLSAGSDALGLKIEEGAAKAAQSIHRHNFHNSVAAAAPTGFRVFEGLNSTFLTNRRIGDSLDVSVRPNNFRLPEDPSIPIVMIAGGIGITPFRAFLEERMWQALQAMAMGRAASFNYGSATLLFGCRNESDHVYLGMAQSAHACGALTHYDVAYAAPQASIFASPSFAGNGSGASFLPSSAALKGIPRMADQLVLENGARIWKALKANGVVYLCGGASGFGAAVTRALKKVFAEHGGMTSTQAEDYIKELLEKDRFLEDLAD